MRVPAVRGVVTAMVLATALLTVPAAIPASAQPDQHWVATWTASPTDAGMADTVSLSML
jgi:hypothetical protein